MIYLGLASHHVIRVTDGKIQLWKSIISLHSKGATNRRILVQFFEFYIRGIGKNGEIKTPDSWKTFHACLKKKQKETCCRTQETRYQTAETSGNEFTGCALKFMKTNPTTKYVTARFPTRHVLFSLPRRLLSYILSQAPRAVGGTLYGRRYESRRTNKFTLWWNLSRPSQHLCPAAKSALQSPFGPCSTGSHRDPGVIH